MHTALALPTTILVLSSVFSSIPYELEEAAMVFGCSPAQAFRHVVLPLVLPGIAASAIFTFVLSWNEVFAATILTIQNRTLPAQVLVTLNRTLPVCWRLLHDDPGFDLYLLHSSLLVQHVGSDFQIRGSYGRHSN
jgi:multiple sugar transport system permease protein